MAQCILTRRGGSGGNLNDGTVLWQNPTSPYFGSGSITVSGLEENYKFISIKFFISNTETDNPMEIIFRKDDFMRMYYLNGWTGYLGSAPGGGQSRRRAFSVSNSTTVNFGKALDDSGAERPGATIPYQIIGYK